MSCLDAWERSRDQATQHNTSLPQKDKRSRAPASASRQPPGRLAILSPSGGVTAAGVPACEVKNMCIAAAHIKQRGIFLYVKQQGGDLALAFSGARLVTDSLFFRSFACAAPSLFPASFAVAIQSSAVAASLPDCLVSHLSLGRSAGMRPCFLGFLAGGL